jgi:uncharacterized protein (DUF433 family)
LSPKEARWHDHWIATEQGVLKGEPHVRGTHRTVAEIQAFWKRPGVGAAQIREAFPDLSEAQLGAAVTWARVPIVEHCFVAESEGPPRRRLYIWSERSALDDERTFIGWSFAYDDMDDDGAWKPGWDSWEESYERILLYPPESAPRDIIWRNEKSGQVVDIYALNLT